jgi:N-acylneuraminate cytidylyltransferase
MLDSRRVISVVPARGGSKSVPGKNVRSLAGKPLIAWAIEAARKTGAIDRVIVSTDDPGIAAVSSEYGAEVYHRPPHLAADESLVIDALRDLVATLRREGENAEIMVLLEATSPLRTPGDVQICLEKLVREGLDSVATFHEAELNPHRAWKIEDGRPEVFIPGAVPWLPRQKLPKAYQLNGAVYAFRIDGIRCDTPSLLFGRSGAVVLPKDRACDIDDEMDFLIAEYLLRRRHDV